MSSSGMDRDINCLTLSIHQFLCRPQRHPPSKCALKDGLEEAVEVHDMPEQCEFNLLTIARRGSSGPTCRLILLRTQSLVAEDRPNQEGGRSGGLAAKQ